MSKLSRGMHDQVPLRRQDSSWTTSDMFGRHILSLWCMFLFSTFRKTFQKVQFPPSERRQKADKNKKKKKKKKEGKKHSFGKKEKISAKSMDDVDRLFECFKCGVSPPRKLSLSLI